jgi:hypothetical protein
MPDTTEDWQTVEYEGFEIHVLTRSTEPDGTRFSYAGYVCHPGADARMPGHTVLFHADGDASYASAAQARDDALAVGREIVDGTHPDLSVLALVTSGA